jgi:hypothetical protein
VPSEALLVQSRTALERVNPPAQVPISADIDGTFRAFLGGKGIIASGPDVQSCLALLTRQVRSDDVLQALMARLRAVWKPHWVKPPTPAQLQKLMRDLPVENSPGSEAKLLKSYLRRWEIYLKTLPSSRQAATVAA